MYPILLNLAARNIAVIGAGAPALRRLAALDRDGAPEVKVYAVAAEPELAAAAGARLVAALPGAVELMRHDLVLIAGLPLDVAKPLAQAARRHGALVNVEDVLELCDFHIPAEIRRGDLVLTVSTNGQAPGLARRLKERLAELFGPEWGERLAALATRRRDWREQGLGPAEVNRRMLRHIEEARWLA